MQMHEQSQLAGAFAPSSSANTAEIVTARKVSRVAQAAPVTHYRTHSRNSSVEMRKYAHSKDGHDGSPRIAPSPIPPPSASLPPTPPFLHRRSPSAAQSILSRSIRKTFRHLSAGLTPDENTELVQKILTDLRPAQASATVKPFSRASRPNSTAVSSPTITASPKMTVSNSSESVADAKRLSASSQSGGEEKLTSSQTSHSSADFATPALSQSRSATPTTPASPMTRANTDEEKVKAADAVAVTDQKALLTPTDALESLRVLEHDFTRSSISLATTGNQTEDSKLSSTTAVASPTKSVAAEKEPAASSSRSGDTALPQRVKRNSSYRKSVPTLDQLQTKKGLGISGESGSKNSPTSGPSSPSSATTETPSWIASLTTLEAVRVLAFQQPRDAAPSVDEVNALQYALNFALSRADKLAETLNKVSEDKIKVETELEILRRNVMSMLGSRSMFSAPSQEQVQVDADGFEIITPKQTKRVSASSTSTTHTVSRPPRVERVAKVAAPAASEPAKPSGGVSIASLRKKAAASAPIPASEAQRYVPPSRKNQDYDAEDSDSDEDGDEDDFDMYPFNKPPPRRALPEVSMTDFLNASRMSKTEILEHDARRELERERAPSEETDHQSFSSHAPMLAHFGSQWGTTRSVDSSRRGFFKGITKLVDQERAKRVSRRSSLVANKPTMSSLAPTGASMARSSSTNNIRKNNGSFTLTYEEASIIPPARAGGRARNGSLHDSLRESVERQSLREAGIRA